MLSRFVHLHLQGILGSTPWNALVFFTLYLQLLGMSDAASSSLMAVFLGGTALGGLLGGWVGDKAAQAYPLHGRILVCQYSVISGVPFSLLLLKASAPAGLRCPYGAGPGFWQHIHHSDMARGTGLHAGRCRALCRPRPLIHNWQATLQDLQLNIRQKHRHAIYKCQSCVHVPGGLTYMHTQGLPYDGGSETVFWYGVVLFLMGLSISWAAPACNNPIFAEIVPSHMRNMIYAFDRSFEGAIAACGAPLVGILAERYFHFVVRGGHACHENTCRTLSGCVTSLQAVLNIVAGCLVCITELVLYITIVLITALDRRLMQWACMHLRVPTVGAQLA